MLSLHARTQAASTAQMMAAPGSKLLEALLHRCCEQAITTLRCMAALTHAMQLACRFGLLKETDAVAAATAALQVGTAAAAFHLRFPPPP